MENKAILDNGWKLRFEPKPLLSGNCQFKFFARRGELSFYGYYLAKPEQSVREVSNRIFLHLEQRLRNADRYHHAGLYQLASHLGEQYVGGDEVIIYST